ncbi:FHA domain-containing protein [Candidatus Chloroploca sp. M-50]|uniref:FHA domain-containing protein n=1 Tax=Candidatus Chloroploca mongolica TaxID=2528176 RepID=A0ABS4DCY7_9CHLR|nr:FHA domain-containing protein [Candidatus Chloroploca mongolica]MBP1467293.1 FHA domain-containing protein [Candidatus Chloroploca mongolica]
MNSFEFWAHMQSYAQMSRLWWYTFAALPAMIIAGGAYPLMAFALRRKTSPPMIFFWLVVAGIPALMVFPSFYISTNLEASLAQVNFAIPGRPQDFPLAQARMLGASLDTLALYGIVGAALTMIIMVAGSLVGDVPVASPIVQQISQSLTKAVTRAMNPGRSAATLSGQYGVLKVIQGSASGSQYVVRNGTIGKQDADILITDTVVSRKHARLEVKGGTPQLIDDGSMNGTYIVRAGQEYELNGAAMELQSGDTIYLGPPSLPTAVAMVYERNGA